LSFAQVVGRAVAKRIPVFAFITGNIRNHWEKVM
jgi:hypothetical protein